MFWYPCKWKWSFFHILQISSSPLFPSEIFNTCSLKYSLINISFIILHYLYKLYKLMDTVYILVTFQDDINVFKLLVNHIDLVLLSEWKEA